MSDVSRILSEIEAGDGKASELLLPLVYDELRRLAKARLALEQPGQTLQATALVHEAYMRLTGPSAPKNWEGKGHFFAAAAKCMRQILVEQARRRKSRKRGGDWVQVQLPVEQLPLRTDDAQLLSLDMALEELGQVDPDAAKLVELRYFAGLTGREASKVLGIPPRTCDRLWAFARSWLLGALGED